MDASLIIQWFSRRQILLNATNASDYDERMTFDPYWLCYYLQCTNTAEKNIYSRAHDVFFRIE